MKSSVRIAGAPQRTTLQLLEASSCPIADGHFEQEMGTQLLFGMF
jgi:hypothetical protein